MSYQQDIVMGYFFYLQIYLFFIIIYYYNYFIVVINAQKYSYSQKQKYVATIRCSREIAIYSRVPTERMIGKSLYTRLKNSEK